MSGIFIHQSNRQLMKMGCDLRVISPVPMMPRILATNAKRMEYRNTPSFHRIDDISVEHPRYFRGPGKLFHPLSSLTMCFGTLGIAGKIINTFKPNILHAFLATPDGFAGIFLGRRFKLPTVISLLGSDVNVYPQRDWLSLRLTKKVITNADRITARSEKLKAKAETLASPKTKIATIYTGCDLKTFVNDFTLRKSLRSQLRISSDAPVLIFVGNVLRTKGVFELLDAFLNINNIIPDMHLIVVGRGPEAQTLRNHVEQAGISHRVHLIGNRPHHEISGWLSAADVLVLPSWSEGLPNVIVEAMACERPVIATRVGGIPEAVEHEQSGILIDKGDLRALKDAIMNLAGDPDKRKRMGQRGRRIVEGRFTWEKNARETLRLYRDIIPDH